ncbi:DinB family protein [Fimbriimonas ginsengisoli]|uniref:DinB-like domain-containing protein n=1 Tax=Fimbriimonas ginsengisoli Gsoil 348 TaxID=661478 RepID=A0A068NWZ9_FIMGI|nr:DinB family protein [Fimbriimonas ginsengisoli]AIE86124.1 hypothetical protein OP10G_2756 [Fimbriimonas ginsengisoli Gsoil 348]
MPSFDACPLDGYPTELGLLLATLQSCTWDWRDELGDVDEDAIVWQARSGGHSIGAVLLHIGEVELYWIEEVVLGREMSEADLQLFMSREIEQYKGQWPSPPRRPLSWYLERLDEVRARTLAAVRDFPAPDAEIPWLEHTVTPRWVLSHVIEHESYHGGQMLLLQDLYAAGS